MGGYPRQHAEALAKLKVKGQRITFTTETRPTDPSTGALGAPVTTTVTGYALGLEKGDPNTYARLGLTFSSAPSIMVVSDTYGDQPPVDATCEWGGVLHTVRDVLPFGPDGVPIYATCVVSR
jgi:hypothetical protein